MIYSFDCCEIDTDRMELRRNGDPVAVEPQVFALLCLLAENQQRMVSKDEILERIWDGRIVTDAALASRIKSARQAIGDDGTAQRVIRTVRGRGFRFVADTSMTTEVGPVVRNPAHSPADETSVASESRPSVAVLPFEWLGADSSDAIVAEALPHDLISALSRLRWLAVIARGSSFRFRSSQTDVTAVGTALNADYCVSGRAERSGQNVVLTIELADTRNAHIVWNEHYRVEVAAIHELRGDIVASVVAALEIRIPQNEASRAHLATPGSLDAWAEYHLGLQAMYRFNRQDNAAARIHFERAKALDPGFARAHAGLSFTSFQDAFLKYAPNSGKAITQSRHHAERAIELDASDPFANFNMGRWFLLTGDPAGGIGWLERSTELSPSFAQGLYSLAWIEALAGQGRAARPHIDEAMRLSPLDPLMYAMLGTRALTHIEQEEFEEAAAWADKAARAPGSHVLLGFIATAAHALAEHGERARSWANNVRERRPDLKQRQFFESFPFANSRMRGAIANALTANDL